MAMREMGWYKPIKSLAATSDRTTQPAHSLNIDSSEKVCHLQGMSREKKTYSGIKSLNDIIQA